MSAPGGEVYKGPDNPLVKFFVERWVITVAIFLTLTLLGLFSATRLGVDLLPPFTIPLVTVSTTYPNAGPEEVENQVSRKIEDAVSGLSGIERISSTSSEGISQVTINFRFGTNIDQATNDVSQRVSAVRGELPRDALAPTIGRLDVEALPVLEVALSADGTDIREVARYAEDVLRPRLRQLAGVGEVNLRGGPQRQVQVLLDPSRVAAFNLSPQQVLQAIQASSVAVPAGSQTGPGQRTLLALRSTVTDPREVGEILLDPSRGLRVRDVAVVRDAQAEFSSITRLSGRQVVTLSVVKSSGANLVGVADTIRESVKELQLPPGYRAEITADNNVNFVRSTVDDTLKEIAVVVIAVSLVVLLTIGKLNSVFSTVLAIPITLAGALVVYAALGLTFNIVSLLAIIVAVGIVVDDSIVVAENIERYRAMGFGPREAVYKGTSEVFSAVAASSLSLLAVFIPITFLPGVIGEFFRQFGIGLSAAILVSWLEALFFLTVRLVYSPDPEPPTWREVGERVRDLRGDLRWGSLQAAFQRPGLSLAGRVGLALILPFTLIAAPLRWLIASLTRAVGAVARTLYELTDRLLSFVRDRYTRNLEWGLGRSWLILGIALLFFLSIGWVAPRIPFNFTATTDNGQVQVDINLPKGVPLEDTNRLVRRVEEYFTDKPFVQDVLATVGFSQTPGISNPESARIIITHGSIKTGRPSVSDLVAQYRPDIERLLADRPEATVRTQQFNDGPGGSSNFEYLITAPTLEALEAVNTKALQVLRQQNYLVTINSTLDAQNREQVLTPILPKLEGTGVTTNDLAQTLRIYNAGVEAVKLRDGGDEIPVVVKADPLLAADQASLLSLPVNAPQLRTSVPLGSLSQFELRSAPAAISRADGAFAATLTANLAPGFEGVSQYDARIQQAFKEARVFEGGATLTVGGAAELTGDLASIAPIAFGIALLLNFLVIAGQFNTLRYPLYLLIPVPLALVGAFWALYLFRSALDVNSVLAVVTLIGLVTKNAILLLDFAVREANQEGLELRKALVEAARLRFRPIIMTSLTVVIITIPLIFAGGEGAEFRRPVGLIIFGGVTVSTLLTLYVVPAAFFLFERRRFERRAKPTVIPSAPAISATD